MPRQPHVTVLRSSLSQATLPRSTLLDPEMPIWQNQAGKNAQMSGFGQPVRGHVSSSARIMANHRTRVSAK